MNRFASIIRMGSIIALILLIEANVKAQQTVEYIGNQVIIKMKEGVQIKSVDAVRSNLKASVLKKFPTIEAELWEISGITVEKAIDQYRNDPRIEYIEPNYRVYAIETIPNDTYFSQLWGMHNTGQTGGTVDADIDAPEAWDINTGDTVLVGVIDTGVDYNHEDLADNIWVNPGEIPSNGIDDDGNGYIDDIHGWDFVNNDNDPYDDNSHGTHCSGTIAGVGDNGIGVAGVCWSTKIMALKFLNAGGSGYISDAILALEYAVTMGANLTNNSWGGGGYSSAMYDAIAVANASNQLFIAAAGNDERDNDVTPHYPSSYDLDNIIAVASTTYEDQMSWFSNWGLTSVDLGAPGSDIYSTEPGNSYGYKSGTSMATPHVAGAVSLVWSQYPSLTNLQIKDKIMNSIDTVAALVGNTVTGGRLNVFNAIQGTGPAALTFQVDMSNEYVGATDIVGIRGGLSPLYWGSTFELQDLDGDNIYDGTVTFDSTLTGNQLEYKYVVQQDNGTLTWEFYVQDGVSGYNNRYLTLVAGEDTLPSVLFNDLPVTPLSQDVTVHFQIDMGMSVDSVDIGGGPNPVGNYVHLFDPEADNIWDLALLFPTGANPNLYYWYGAFFDGAWHGDTVGVRETAIPDTSADFYLPPAIWGTPHYPDITYYPDSLYESLLTGQTATQYLTLGNDGDVNLEFSFPEFAAEELLNTPGVEHNNASNDFEHLELGKGEDDPREGNPVILGAGGPDNFGYNWIDSDEPGGPAFNWIDISTTGSLVTGLSDDNYVGPFPISFDFSFYNSTYSQFYIQSNGLINFDPMYITYDNQPIPLMDSYDNLIAWCWDDLYPYGSVYYQDFGDKLVIQFVDYGECCNGGTTDINAEVILYPSGKIILQYLNTLNGFDIYSSTIGIENVDGSDGLQVAFNTGYIHDSLAVSIATIPDWLSVLPTSGTIYPGYTQDIEVTFDAAGMGTGDYDANLQISSNDPDESEVNIPAHLTVTGAPDIAVSDTSIIFDSTFVGGSVTDTLIVSNEGTDLLTVNNISSDTADFFVDTTNFILYAGESQMVFITFSPSSVGTIFGGLTIESDDPDEPTLTVNLQGEGLLPPDIAVSPDSLSADLFTGDSTIQILTIDNSAGGSDLYFDISIEELGSASIHFNRNIKDAKNLKSSGLVGVNSSFGKSADLDAGSSLQPFSPGDALFSTPFSLTSPLGITMSPSGDIWVASLWDGQTVHYDENLTEIEIINHPTGTSTTPGVAYDNQNGTLWWLNADAMELVEGDLNGSATGNVIPITVGGGGLPTGIEYDSQTDHFFYVDIVNDDIYAINRSGSVIAGYPVPQTDYDTGTGIFGNGLDVIGGYLDVLVGLSGEGQVTRSVPTDKMGSNIGVEKETPVTSTGDTFINDVIRSRIVPNEIMYLVGNATEYIYAIEPSELDLATFITTNPSGGIISAGGAIDVEVTFDATGMNGGDYDANIVINSNDPDEPVVEVPAHLHVTGAPDITASPDTLDYGIVFVGQSSTDILLVSNEGTDSLVVSSITSDNSDYTIDTTSFILNPGENQEVLVTFTPDAAGVSNGILTIESNDPDEPTVEITLLGEALQPPIVGVSPTFISDNLFTGDSSVHAITISNDASAGASELYFNIAIESDSITQLRIDSRLNRQQAYNFHNIPDNAEYVKDRVLIRLKNNVQSDEIELLKQTLNATVIKKYRYIDTELWSISGISVADAVNNYYNDPRVLYIEPDYKVNAINVPNDPMFSDLWGMHNTGQTGGTPDADIDAPEAWDKGTGGDVIIGVIDTGVDYNHEDLSDNIWTNEGEVPGNGIDDDGNGYIDDIHGWDFVNNDNDPMDDNNHGSHCSGTIAGVGNNGIGVAGVCWNAKVMGLKFLSAAGSGNTSDAVSALEYAITNGANLTSNSWGGGGYSATMYDAILAAGAANQLFIAAAGNSGTDNDVIPHYPSSYDCENVVAVAATDHNDNIPSFSCYGATSVDLGAPGVSILSTTLGNTYSSFNGTSMATPHVSGAAALVWSQAPSLSNLEVKQHIMDYTDPVASLAGITVTGGRLNVNNILANINIWVYLDTTSGVVTPGSSMDVNATLNATGLYGGTYNANIIVFSNDPDTSEIIIDVELNVTGVPDIAVSTDTLDFGGVFIGDTLTSSLLVTNNGTDSLIVSNISSDNSEYSVDTTNFNLDPEQEQTVKVSFTPTSEGAISGVLTIESNDPDESPYTVVLQGEGLIPPEFAVAPDSLADSLNTGETSTQILTISNSGGSDLEFEILIESTNAAAFSVEIHRPEWGLNSQNRNYSNKESSEMSPYFGNNPPSVGIFAQWDLLFNYDLESPTGGDNRHVGVEFDGTYFYVSAGDGFTGSTHLYKFDSLGNLVNTFPQPGGATGWGLRDLAWDGQYLYGSDDGMVTAFDGNGNLITEFPGPESPNRALAYDPTTDHFWTANWGSPIYEFDRSGNVISSYPDHGLTGIYGMAWDNFTEGGPYLWIFDQEGSPAQTFYQFDPVSGQLTGTAFTVNLGDGSAMAGGAFLTTAWDPSIVVLGGLSQSSPDLIFGYELAPSNGGWLSVNPVSSTIPAGSYLDIEVTFDAMGMNGGDYDANINISHNALNEPSPYPVPAHLHVTGAPDIAVSDTLFDFGSLFIGTSVTDTLVISNEGTDILTVDTLYSDNSDYAISIDTTSFELGPGESDEALITFTPSSEGMIAGTLTIESNDPDESPLLIVLQGEGLIPPEFAVAPDSLADSLNTGETSTQILTISNSGGSDLNFDISIEGVEAAAVSVKVHSHESRSNDSRTLQSVNLLRAGLSPEETANGINASYVGMETVSLPFDEGFEDGNYDGWIDDGGSGTKEVTDATAAAGVYSFHYYYTGRGDDHFHGIHQEFDAGSQPEYVSFYIRSGSTSTADAYFVLRTNGGSYDVIWFYANSTGFLYVNGERSYTYNALQWYHIEFKDINWVDKNFDYYVDGSLIESDIPFRNAGSVNDVDALYLHNFHTGSEAWWDQIHVGTEGGADWLTVTPNSGTIPSETSMEIEVTFDATGMNAGDYDATINILHNALNEPSPFSVPAFLHVTGAPDISIFPDSLNFSTLFVGATSTDTLYISNIGSEVLTVTDITSDDSVYTVDLTTFNLNPGEVQEVVVTFTPDTVGSYPGTLTIFNNDTTVEVSVYGEGVEAPDIAISPSELNETLLPDGMATQYLAITNTGGSDLNWGITIGVSELNTNGNIGFYADQSRLCSKVSLPHNFIDPGLNGILDIGDVLGTYGNFPTCCTGMTWANGNLYVIDYCSYQLHQYDISTQQVVATFSIHGEPYGIAWDGQYLWIGDYYGNIYGYDLSGNNIGSFSCPFNNYPSMTWDGQYFIVSYPWDNNPTFYRLDHSGAIIAEYTATFGSSCDQIVWDNEYLWGNDPDNSRIIQLSMESGLVNLVSDFTFYDNDWSYSIAHNGVDLWWADWDGPLFQIDDGEEGISWLSYNPLSGIIPPDSTQEVEVTFDATGLEPSIYNDTLFVNSNDPDEGSIELPVSLTVTPPEPVLELTGFTIDDDNFANSTGNGDGIANPGEFLEVYIEIVNSDTIHTYSGVYAIPDSSFDPYVHPNPVYFFDDYIGLYQDISPGDTMTFADDFEFVIATNTPGGYELTIPLQIFDDLDHLIGVDTLRIPVNDSYTQAPYVYIANVQPGYTPPGTPVDITAWVKAGADITNVTAEIESPDENVITTIALTPTGWYSYSGFEYIGTYTPSAELDFVIDINTEDEFGNTGIYDNRCEFTTVPFTKENDILIVADEYKNTYLGAYTQALNEKALDYDIWKSWLRGLIDTTTINQYINDGMVIWYSGWTSPQLDSLERQVLGQYMDNGGRVFYNDQDLGWYIHSQDGSPEAIDWYTNYMHASYVADYTGLYGVNGIAGDAITDGMDLELDNVYGGWWPSEIDPIGDAVPIFEYDVSDTVDFTMNPQMKSHLNYDDFTSSSRQNVKVHPDDIFSSGTAGLRINNETHKLVYLSFGFESIANSTNRADLLYKIIEWLAPEIVIKDVEIALNSGWNLISWNTDTEFDSTREVLSGILDNLIVALGFDNGGLTFKPELPDFINTLNIMDHMYGYWLKMDAEDTLYVTGRPVNPQTPYYLNENWNLISYLPDECDSTRNALFPVMDSLTVALGFDNGGLTFKPELPDFINTLNIMSPTFGYWVKMTGNDTLIYPETQVAEQGLMLAKAANSGQSSKYNVISTNEWINLFGIGVELDKKLLPKGTIVKVVDSDDIVCGEYMITEDGMFGLMPIYRDDPTTKEKDEGALPGDKLTIYFDEFEVPFKIKWTGNGAVFDMNELISAYGEELRTLPKTYALSRNYPNPFNPITTIKYQLPKVSDVKLVIYNILGQEVMTLVSENQPAGYYQVIWNGKNNHGAMVSSGVYIYHVTAGKFTKTRKMLMVK